MPHNYTRYIVISKGRVVHGGITHRPLMERAREHRQRWPGAFVKKVGPRVTEYTARKWERDNGYS